MITTTSGAQISAEEFVELLRAEGMLGDLVPRVSRRLQIARLAQEEALAPTDAELQAGADAFRHSLGMRSAAATRDWLRSNQMTDDDFQTLVENRLVERKLENGVSDGAVEERFEREKSRFDRIRLAQIVVGSLGLAEELSFRIREESADFAEAAREHSLDDLTRDNGGHLGQADRNSFDGEICQALFAAAQGDVVGPFSADDSHYLFQILEVFPARLDEVTVRAVRRLILDERLRETAAGSVRELAGAAGA